LGYMERALSGPTSVDFSGRVQWPSKSSILETPERKRFRHSESFADSGLGSSLFGSPPCKLITVAANAQTLKTPPRWISPTTDSSESNCSPIR
uniref:Uncharacterized protein n=1 Tax=Gongylonema pulchrum TaxID=637853 RepID=A0A183EB54_9BILA